jgi:hypothetical protein
MTRFALVALLIVVMIGCATSPDTTNTDVEAYFTALYSIPVEVLIEPIRAARKDLEAQILETSDTADEGKHTILARRRSYMYYIVLTSEEQTTENPSAFLFPPSF